MRQQQHAEILESLMRTCVTHLSLFLVTASCFLALADYVGFNSYATYGFFKMIPVMFLSFLTNKIPGIPPNSTVPYFQLQATALMFFALGESLMTIGQFFDYGMLVMMAGHVCLCFAFDWEAETEYRALLALLWPLFPAIPAILFESIRRAPINGLFSLDVKVLYAATLSCLFVKALIRFTGPIPRRFYLYCVTYFCIVEIYNIWDIDIEYQPIPENCSDEMIAKLWNIFRYVAYFGIASTVIDEDFTSDDNIISHFFPFTSFSPPRR